MNEYATYIRVSTKRQGASGLGLEAQRKMCSDFIGGHGWKQTNEFMDVESGTHTDRKGLWQAIEFCKANGCGLVIAKLDRLARNIEFCFKVINTGVEIHFTDMPQMNTLLLGVFAAVAQYERELTSERTTKALSVKKSSGAKLGAASEKYKATRNNKSEQEKNNENMKRGEMKRLHFQESRDTQTFLRVLRKVFPLATKAEQPDKWNWQDINVIGDNKANIIAEMKDYKEFDSEGKLFRKWDLSKDPHDRQQVMKLAAYIQRVRRSYVGS